LLLEWADGDENASVNKVSNKAWDWGGFRVMESCSVTYRGTMLLFGGLLNSKEMAIVGNCGITISDVELPIARLQK